MAGFHGGRRGGFLHFSQGSLQPQGRSYGVQAIRPDVRLLRIGDGVGERGVFCEDKIEDAKYSVTCLKNGVMNSWNL